MLASTRRCPGIKVGSGQNGRCPRWIRSNRISNGQYPAYDRGHVHLELSRSIPESAYESAHHRRSAPRQFAPEDFLRILSPKWFRRRRARSLSEYQFSRDRSGVFEEGWETSAEYRIRSTCVRAEKPAGFTAKSRWRWDLSPLGDAPCGLRDTLPRVRCETGCVQEHGR